MKFYLSLSRLKMTFSAEFMRLRDIWHYEEYPCLQNFIIKGCTYYSLERIVLANICNF